MELPYVPEGCEHNAHMFYIKLRDLQARTSFISFMKEHGVGCVFHYVPLHSAPAGERFGRFNGTDEHTTLDSDRLVRLPMYYGMSLEDFEYVVSCAKEFFLENAEA